MITAEQNARLKALAAASGKAEGELLREVLEKVLAEEHPEGRDWKGAWAKAAGIWANYPELDDLLEERRAARKRRRARIARDFAR